MITYIPYLRSRGAYTRYQQGLIHQAPTDTKVFIVGGPILQLLHSLTANIAKRPLSLPLEAPAAVVVGRRATGEWYIRVFRFNLITCTYSIKGYVSTGMFCRFLTRPLVGTAADVTAGFSPRPPTEAELMRLWLCQCGSSSYIYAAGQALCSRPTKRAVCVCIVSCARHRESHVDVLTLSRRIAQQSVIAGQVPRCTYN